MFYFMIREVYIERISPMGDVEQIYIKGINKTLI
jgi:hypothetical protein